MSEVTGNRALLVYATKHNIPLDVCLELTHHCNFRCQHCYIPDFLAPDMLTTERVLSLLAELAEMGTLYLTLSGGEMLIRKDWLEIARGARDLGFALRLFTNGALVTSEIADAMRELGCVVEVSLYTTDEETFDRITRRAGSYRKVIRGIELLVERGVPLVIKAPVMSLTLGAVDGLFRYAGEIGADCRVDHKIVHAKDGGLVPLRVRATEEELIPYYRGPHTSCAIPEEYLESPDNEGPMCAAANRFCNITASGDVTACNILPGSGGNVRDTPFREIWEQSPWLEKIRAIRRRDIRVCSGCDKIAYCERCHAQALVEDGDLYGPSSWSCEHAAVVERIAEERRRERASDAGV